MLSEFNRKNVPTNRGSRGGSGSRLTAGKRVVHKKVMAEKSAKRDIERAVKLRNQ